MSQSLANLHVHLIFSTKDRMPVLPSSLKEQLHGYMASVLAELNCQVILINSMPDHVHVLFNLARTAALAKVVEHVKRSSSKWLKSKGAAYGKFSWQSGYGAFSVSESKVTEVANYIRNQEEHHRKSSFQDEFTKFLKHHRIAFDEKYVWD
jgi:putative transposase